ncbi:zona pellucida sperm-binding protein 3 [Esox lucius]|uniref:Zona pellucida sperm-binding protein 3 n=1 Tax=Esox lucius TaxID=8010 RepID=A0A3P8Z567_ESOLU|nr:zona pellucida sperm-binding protein 3 [Esox lucius]
MKWSVVCLVAVAMHGCLSDAQSKYPPIRPLYPPKNRNPVKIQPKELIQSKQQFETPLDWTYPANPVPEAKVYGRSERRSPVAANSVVIFCNENMIHVEAKQDLLGIGELIHIDDLVLGDCAHTGFDNANNVIIFQAELQACGSFLTMTDASLIYSFMLNYKPNPLTSTTIIRTNDVSITVECHYPRKHNVSSMALIPTWTPFSSAKYAEEFLYFSLRLMTADWQYERDSNEFSLGDILNIEASVMQYFHVPLRVFVDSCVATLEPNPNASPNYAFIDNHGCLIDAKITGSHSMFMARSEDHKLHFQLEAFRFGSQKTGSPSQIYHKPSNPMTTHKKTPYISPRARGTKHPHDSTLGNQHLPREQNPDGRTPVDITAHTSPPKQHDMIYITCHLKAARVSMPIDSNYKACSFVNTWREAGGNDGMCNCCDSTCGTRNARDVTRPKTPAYTWEGDVQLGPIIISEKVM